MHRSLANNVSCEFRSTPAVQKLGSPFVDLMVNTPRNVRTLSYLLRDLIVLRKQSGQTAPCAHKANHRDRYDFPTTLRSAGFPHFAGNSTRHALINRSRVVCRTSLHGEHVAPIAAGVDSRPQAVQTLTAQNYHTFVENNEYTVVDYYTDWSVSTP